MRFGVFLACLCVFGLVSGRQNLALADSELLGTVSDPYDGKGIKVAETVQVKMSETGVAGLGSLANAKLKLTLGLSFVTEYYKRLNQYAYRLKHVTDVTNVTLDKFSLVLKDRTRFKREDVTTQEVIFGKNRSSSIVPVIHLALGRKRPHVYLFPYDFDDSPPKSSLAHDVTRWKMRVTSRALPKTEIEEAFTPEETESDALLKAKFTRGGRIKHDDFLEIFRLFGLNGTSMDLLDQEKQLKLKPREISSERCGRLRTLRSRK